MGSKLLIDIFNRQATRSAGRSIHWNDNKRDVGSPAFDAGSLSESTVGLNSQPANGVRLLQLRWLQGPRYPSGTPAGQVQSSRVRRYHTIPPWVLFSQSNRKTQPLSGIVPFWVAKDGNTGPATYQTFFQHQPSQHCTILLEPMSQQQSPALRPLAWALHSAPQCQAGHWYVSPSRHLFPCLVSCYEHPDLASTRLGLVLTLVRLVP